MFKKWRQSEKQTADRHGGKLTFGSGSTPFEKGDVLTTNYMIENKSTQANSYSLKMETLKKLKQEAAKSGKLSYLVLDFVEHNNGRFVIIDEDIFLDLLNEQTT